MASLDTQEWRQARQWLISTGVIPPTHRVTKPDVDLVDFARSLRDGVFLCSLLEKLKPGYCSDWNPKPVMQASEEMRGEEVGRGKGRWDNREKKKKKKN